VERKRAAKGITGNGRKLKAGPEVNEIVKASRWYCADCGALLMGEDPEPERHQVSEVPKIKAIVVE